MNREITSTAANHRFVNRTAGVPFHVPIAWGRVCESPRAAWEVVKSTPHSHPDHWSESRGSQLKQVAERDFHGAGLFRSQRFQPASSLPGSKLASPWTFTADSLGSQRGLPSGTSPR